MFIPEHNHGLMNYECMQYDALNFYDESTSRQNSYTDFKGQDFLQYTITINTSMPNFRAKLSMFLGQIGDNLRFGRRLRQRSGFRQSRDLFKDTQAGEATRGLQRFSRRVQPLSRHRLSVLRGNDDFDEVLVAGVFLGVVLRCLRQRRRPRHIFVVLVYDYFRSFLLWRLLKSRKLCSERR